MQSNEKRGKRKVTASTNVQFSPSIITRSYSQNLRIDEGENQDTIAYQPTTEISLTSSGYTFTGHGTVDYSIHRFLLYFFVPSVEKEYIELSIRKNESRYLTAYTIFIVTDIVYSLAYGLLTKNMPSRSIAPFVFHSVDLITSLVIMAASSLVSEYMEMSQVIFTIFRCLVPLTVVSFAFPILASVDPETEEKHLIAYLQSVIILQIFMTIPLGHFINLAFKFGFWLFLWIFGTTALFLLIFPISSTSEKLFAIFLYAFFVAIMIFMSRGCELISRELFLRNHALRKNLVNMREKFKNMEIQILEDTPRQKVETEMEEAINFFRKAADILENQKEQDPEMIELSTVYIRLGLTKLSHADRLYEVKIDNKDKDWNDLNEDTQQYLVAEFGGKTKESSVEPQTNAFQRKGQRLTASGIDGNTVAAARKVRLTTQASNLSQLSLSNSETYFNFSQSEVLRKAVQLRAGRKGTKESKLSEYTPALTTVEILQMIQSGEYTNLNQMEKNDPFMNTGDWRKRVSWDQGPGGQMHPRLKRVRDILEKAGWEWNLDLLRLHNPEQLTHPILEIGIFVTSVLASQDFLYFKDTLSYGTLMHPTGRSTKF
eukprot:GHVP01037171.1.p1 GENE.GHVP01037171.1~~GHVP01037171.1.p1  ORF type:complete len:600 (-),score=84.90 GHVP01037171.1:580-2379(-)